MPENRLRLKLLLISPSDVAADRYSVKRSVDHWNAHIGDILSVTVETVGWDTHSAPDLSGPAQEVLDRQIVDGADLAVALFGRVLGRPHPRTFPVLSRKLSDCAHKRSV